MQNDRGRFRCYRHCSIGERHRRGATEARGRQSSVSSFRGVLPRTYSLRRVHNISICIAAIGKTKFTYTYRQCGGLCVVSCPALSQIQFDPRDISLDLADDTRLMDRDSRALSLHRQTATPEISSRLSECPLTFTLNVHCDVRAKVRKKSSGIVDCGIDTENRDR